MLDLDGTLLRTDKTISLYSLDVLEKCRAQGILLAVATARGKVSALGPISQIKPDIVISSSGALVSYRGDHIYRRGFTADETRILIARSFELVGTHCEVTVDTEDAHYWNYKGNPEVLYLDYPETVYTDYQEFDHPSLKLCVNIADYEVAGEIAAAVTACSYKKFSDGDWFQFTKNDASKGKALEGLSCALGVPLAKIISFGDDFVDISMLELSGWGVAVENAIAEVKAVADAITESNDRDGVAKYLDKYILG